LGVLTISKTTQQKTALFPVGACPLSVTTDSEKAQAGEETGKVFGKNAERF
jgi:hypothetical protein